MKCLLAVLLALSATDVVLASFSRRSARDQQGRPMFIV